MNKPENWPEGFTRESIEFYISEYGEKVRVEPGDPRIFDAGEVMCIESWYREPSTRLDNKLKEKK